MISVAAVLSVFLAQTPAPKAATPAATTSKAAPPAAAPAKPAAAPASPAAAPAKPATAAPKPVAAAPMPAPAAPKSTMTPPVAIPENDTEKAVYALGLMMSQTLAQFDLSPRELDLIKQAVTDSAAGKTAVELSEWQPKIGPLAQERRQHIAEKEKEKIGRAHV